MTKHKLILILNAVVAVIIIAIAAYTFSNYSTIDKTQGLIMIAVGIIGIFIVLGIIIVLMRSLNNKK
jgi:nitrate reductase gamma subunit